jgi:hypothetical protein
VIDVAWFLPRTGSEILGTYGHFTSKKRLSQTPRFGHVLVTFSPPLLATLGVKAALKAKFSSYY